MKTVYTGVDIIEIARIEEAIKEPAFIEKIFTKAEIKNCKRKNQAEYYAGRFAAKEAIYKAISKRMEYETLDWLDVEILSDKNGRPIINFLTGSLKRYEKRMDLSISHNRTMSVATAALVLD